MTTAPLHGLRVLEYATGIAGPYAGRLLASLGATVVKVEPVGGDAARTQPIDDSPIPEGTTSPLFTHLNAGKLNAAPSAIEEALRALDLNSMTPLQALVELQELKDKLVYAVDGAQIFSKTDESGTLDEKKKFEVFNGSIVPGNHTISVMMVFRGHGYGIFSYLKGYKFTVRSSHTFTAGEGRQTSVTVRAYEKGNITTELKDRPAVDFKVNLVSIGKGGAR